MADFKMKKNCKVTVNLHSIKKTVQLYVQILLRFINVSKIHMNRVQQSIISDAILTLEMYGLH